MSFMRKKYAEQPTSTELEEFKANVKDNNRQRPVSSHLANSIFGAFRNYALAISCVFQPVSTVQRKVKID